MTTTDSSSERMMTPEQVVTGEAVALEVTHASVPLRMLSGAIDYVLYLGGLLITFLTWWRLIGQGYSQAGTARAAAQVSLILALWMLVIPAAVEVLTRGYSAGKLVTGCRVVRDDGGSVRLRHGLLRALSATLEVWVTQGALAIITCAVSPRAKRIGDLLAGTYVVRTRSATAQQVPLLMPPELAQWARGADVRALPGNLSLVARTFLQRASTLDSASRQRIGRDLAAQAALRVFPAPPAGTHPERFLAAVLCERRDREYEAARHDRHLADAQAQRLRRLPLGVGSYQVDRP